MGIVLGIIIAVLLIGAITGVVIFVEKNKKGKIITFSVLSLGLLIAFVFVPFGFTQIDTTEIAVVREWGEITGIRGAGLQFRNILSSNFQIYDLTVQQVDLEYEAYSADAQAMTVQLTVQYQLNSEKILDIASKYGTQDILNERLSAIIVEKTKSVFSNYSAMTIIEVRASLSGIMLSSLQLIQSNYNVRISNVAIKDIAFNDAFEAAVEAKMIAEQEQLQAEYEKEKSIIQAEALLEVERLNAEAKIVEAQGNAEAQILIAQAQAETIRVKSIEIARMMGFTITEDGNIDMSGKTDEEIAVINSYLKYIEYLSTWNGELPDVIAGDTTGIIIQP